LREPDARREVAIAFMHGFLLRKSGAATFNPQNIVWKTCTTRPSLQC
jgi:hypothetical protein